MLPLQAAGVQTRGRTMTSTDLLPTAVLRRKAIDSLNEAFALAAGQFTMNHAERFIHEITVFLVDERRVV
jgi:hypothetical protein